MAKKGIGGVITGSIILFLGAIIITAGVGGRVAVNTFLVEPMVGSTFQDIEDQAIPELEPATKDMAYPMFLDEVYTQMQYAFGGDPANLAAFINCSTSMQLIGQMMTDLAPAYGGDPMAALFGIYNDNIQGTYSTPVRGASEWIGGALSYTADDVSNLSMGAVAYPLPGILEEDPLGDGTPGMLAFLSIYADPTAAGFPDAATLATVGYGLPSVNHLDNIAGWITMELFPIVPVLITSALGWNAYLPAATAATAGDYILAQWGALALIPGGLGTLDPAATNFEVGSTNFDNLTQVSDVWNSLVGGDFLRWYAGDTDLITELGISSAAYTDVINWIPVVEPTVLAAVAGEYGLTYTTPADLYLRLFVGQWMHIGYLLDDPLFSMLGSDLVFEIDFPTAYVLDSDTGLALWTQLKSEDGIKKWYAAVDDYYGPEYLELKEYWGFGDEQMGQITSYLAEWRDTTLFALNQQEEMIALPIWGYDLAQALDDMELYLPIAGGVFACAGVLLIALFARKRA
jgi:hypothetical protein